MKIKILLLSIVLLSTSNAFAGTIFTPGTSKHVNSDIAYSDGAYIIVNFEAGRSYCCDFYTKNADFIQTLETNLYNSSNGQVIGTSVNRTLTTPSSTAGILERRCTTPASAGTYSFKLTNIGGPNPGSVVTPYCVETSLYGGYNTNAARYNFLEVLNTTNSTINFKVTATNFDGTTVINNTAYSVQAGRRLDIDIHTPAGLGKYGLLKITHDGPYGSLQAGVSFYKTDLTQTSHVPLKSREQFH